MLDFFNTPLSALDPAVHDLIDYEAERQARKLILIPSESQAPEAVREALGSVFQNIYAEGYPDPASHGLTEAQILDYEVQLATYRRNSDQRYYKGVEYADIVEALARRRAAEAFAANGIAPEEIYANVQPLSGSPANSAVYAALVPPGSTVMGMDLLHGGHLTHGSPANRSGKLYKIVSYGIDPATERLNYDADRGAGRKHKPKMIIAGFTSYPWMPDWARFRQIADAVGAYLLADISHIAGMVAAGVVPSPIGYAHVDQLHHAQDPLRPARRVHPDHRQEAGRQDRRGRLPRRAGRPARQHHRRHGGRVQAGPHAGVRAASAADRGQCPTYLAAELERHGLRIPYGGTDTHMLLVDCKSVRAATGVSPDGGKGTPLMGDPAARILDLAGIVLNRNTIPGDKSARNPSGIRLGTPWITQRGFEAPQIERLAEIIARVLQACQPLAYAGRHGPVYHAQIDFDLLEQAKWDIVDLACCVDLGPDYKPSGYPHHYFMHKPSTDPGGDWDVIEIEGPHARGFCNVAMTNDVYALRPGECQPTWVLEPDGRLMAAGVLKRPGDESTRFQLLIAKEAEPRVAHWLRALSDGFVCMDPDDPYVKAPGPVVVRRLSHEEADGWEMRPPAADEFAKETVGWALHKPYWIGQTARADAPGGLQALPPFAWEPPANPPLLRTRLYEQHRKLGAKMVPFAGYEMPVQYTSVLDEHQAVRAKAGLFDVSHMGLFEFSGENVHLFLNNVTTNDVSLIKVGGSQYSFLLAPDGSVVDDIWVYRLDQERYWMVVNASNNDKDWAWINAVREARVLIDPARPWSRALGYESVVIRDLRDPQWGDEQRAQIALQGPRSRDILLALVGDDDGAMCDRLMDMQRTEIIGGTLAGYDVWLARTGYTGEPMAFEMFVHPDDLPAFWRDLLRVGAAFGLKPCGLAARDSLRIEAGLPLYGHELAGPLDLNPSDAGFAPYVKLSKPFFIGKAAFVAHELKRQSRLARFQADEEHGPMLGQGDVIVNAKGRVVGYVTSCSIDTNGRQTGLCFVQDPNWQRGTKLGVYRLGNRNWENRALDALQPGDRIQLPEGITIIERFLNKQ